MPIFRNSYFLAVLLHLGAFGALAFYTSKSQIASPPSAGSNKTVASEATPQTDGLSSANAPFAQGQLESKLSASVAAAERLTPTEQLGVTGDYAKQLESISSVASMKEMGVYLRSTVSWQQRPSLAEAGKESIFDHATSVPVGAKRSKDGRYVFVFKDSNSNSIELPAAPGDEYAAQAMALLDRSAVLQELKNSILLPMLNQRLDSR